MREQGGGTLFSPAIERTKLSVKITESSESRRRLNSSGGYTSYVGTKPLPGSMLPAAPGGGRLKGGSSIHGSGVRHNPNHNNELSDHSASERVKEFLAESEPVVKRKVAPPPLLEEGGVLPQWGRGKRSRCSRFELSKHSSATRAHEFESKALVPVEKQPNGEGVEAKLRGQGGPTRPAIMAANSHGTKAAAAARNGISSRLAANGFVNNNSNSIMASERERERPSAHMGDQGSAVSRQRREGGTEPATTAAAFNGHHNCNGHNFNAAAATQNNAAAASSSEAQQQAKPKADLETLEWPRIFIGLSRKEKEDDFFIFKGTKLPQRPKKRPKAVERAIHYCTPGNSLCDLVRGRYDVREKKCVKKKPRGLKAMDSMESESE